jgi:hypothetical protein
MLLEYFDIKISIFVSLAVIVVCLAASILYSLDHNRRKAVSDARRSSS